MYVVLKRDEKTTEEYLIFKINFLQKKFFTLKLKGIVLYLKMKVLFNI
jgi:hypothetical protein